jgi:hypothetical protein
LSRRFRILNLLIVVRLLVPPGVCVCDLPCLAAALPGVVLQCDEDAPPEHEHDEHAPGCPCSPLSAVLGLRPSPAPPPAVAAVALSPDLAADAPPLSAHDEPRPLSGARPAESPLYLTHCSLLV